MRMMGKGSLASVLRWVTDAAIAGWILLLIYTLSALVSARAPSGPHRQQGMLDMELDLPAELVRPTTPDVDVVNFQARRSVIHYRTPEISLLDNIAVFSYTLVSFCTTIWILWNVRQMLASLVAGEPLTLRNSARFRNIGWILVFRTAAEPVWGSLGYLRLQELFSLIPPRGFIELYASRLSLTGLLTALLFVLMSEVMRLGTQHRLDSEAVI